MRNRVYSLLDTKAGVYMRPAFYANDAMCIRDVIELVRAKDNLVSRHPGDFVLVCLGEFDDQTGALIPSSPVTIGTVIQFISRNIQPELPDLVSNSPGHIERQERMRQAQEFQQGVK